jgi:phage terminase large subunit
VGTPNPRQKEFFAAKARFVAYGGARGGGKSWAVRKKAMLLALRYPGIRMLLARRTLGEVWDNHILPLQQDLAGIARYRDAEKAFLFANGSRLKFGYCDSERDVLQYQGQEYDVIFLDEATQFTEFQFFTLTACLRGTGNCPRRMYLTCNPGGVGHGWVKRLFIDRDYRPGERAADYRFIPARVYDNTALVQQDPGYVHMLENLPEDLRRAWLEGDWNAFAGQYFKEWRRDVHVLTPFAVPAHWRRYVALDYGLDMLAALFIALAPDGSAYVYREVYRSGLIGSQAAEALREAAQGEDIYAWLAPPDLWNRRQDTGRSVAEIFADHGTYLYKVSNDRVAGWMEVKQALAINFDGEGEDARPIEGPKLKIDAGCRNLIKSFPYLLADEKNVGDVAKEPHEYTHGPDAIRYLLAGRPMYTPTKEELRREWADRWETSYDEQERDFLDYGR